MNKQFIDCVRQHPCLWDMNIPAYRDFDAKNKAWRKIAEETKIDNVKLAKIKWKNLRDTHREKLNKIADIKLTHSKKKIRPWRYMGQMEFLIPFMTSRERDNLENDLTATRVEREKQKGESNKESSRKSKGEESLLELLKRIEENRRDDNDEVLPRTPDALKTFFDSMYESTKKLPEHLQREVKKKLFNSVMEAEEKLGSCEPSHTTRSPGANARDSLSLTSGSAPQSPSTTRRLDIATVKLEPYINGSFSDENDCKILP